MYIKHSSTSHPHHPLTHPCHPLTHPYTHMPTSQVVPGVCEPTHTSCEIHMNPQNVPWVWSSRPASTCTDTVQQTKWNTNKTLYMTPPTFSAGYEPRQWWVLLLCRISTTNAALEHISDAPEQLQAKKPVFRFFGRSFPICSEAVLKCTFGKNILSLASFCKVHKVPIVGNYEHDRHDYLVYAWETYSRCCVCAVKDSMGRAS